MINFYKKKRVLITGHTGFKGAWLAATLLGLGSEVCGYSLEPRESLSLYKNLNLDKNIRSEINDIRNLDALKYTVKSFKPDIVFHLAAQPIVRKSYDDPVGTYDTNVMGTVNLLEASRYCDSIKSIVNITTDKVYENKETDRGYIESDNLCGYDPYSNSKSCSELVTYSYTKSFFNLNNSPAVSTARAGNVIGAGDFSKDRIIPDCVRAGLENKPIEIRNPNSIRPYQYVLDCLRGYLILARMQYDDREIAGNYNFGPDETDCINTKDLVEKFCDAWGEDLKYIIKNQSSVHESNLLKLDSSKSKRRLNWNPIYNIDMAISKTAHYYKILHNGEFNNKAYEHINEFFKDWM